MNKIKKTMMAAAILAGTCVAPVAAITAMGQELTDASGNVVSDNAAAGQSGKSGGGFYDIVFGSGIVGTILWFALFGDGALAIYFSIDSSILIKPDKLMPKRLMDGVQGAMAEGDVVKAMGTGRRSAELRFTRFVGHSILTEIEQVRFRRACELIRRPGAQLDTVHAAVGYGNARSLRALFYRLTGQSPSAWLAARKA